MNSMGTFINLVFRDSNHHIHNAASLVLVVFDTECYESWKALMNFAVAVYGKEFFINAKLSIVADRDKGFDKAFHEVLKPFGVERFCCSNHLGENIQKKFKKEPKYNFLNAVKAKNKSDCYDWFNKLPDKLKNQLEMMVSKRCSYFILEITLVDSPFIPITIVSPTITNINLEEESMW
jgi:hypothetical protein